MNRENAREALRGPIASIRTPFNSDGSIDFAGMQKNIDMLISINVSAIMLTSGDSHYDALSELEIGEITKVTAKQIDKKCVMIAADRYHTTKRAIKFAEFCKDVGADIYMALPPDWANSCTPDSLSEHYAAVSEEMPVMIVTNRFISRGMQFGLETLEKSFKKSDKIVAVKDDMCGNFARKLCLLAQKHNVAVIAGGQKSNHMNMYPYCVDGYLSTLIHFRPDLTEKYWSSIRNDDLPAAVKVIENFDMPFFDYIIRGTGGFDAGIHSVMEIFGIYKRYRRQPYYTYTERDMELLKEYLIKIKILQR